MSRNQAGAVRIKGALAVLLTWVGGYVDGVGYLILFDLFTSHQSGNSVVLGVSIGTEHWTEALHRGFVIPMFVTGLAAGTILHHALRQRRIRALLALPLALEAVLLGLFLVCGGLAIRDGVLEVPAVYYPIAALPALAMGLQNTTLRKVGGVGLRTTFVTGILSGFAEEAVAYGLWFRGRQRGHGWQRWQILLCLSPRQASFNHMLLLGGLWLGFLAGAVCGALAKLHWGVFSLLGPIAALVIIILFDLRQPLAASSDTDY
jgi:uncharacterized membrane protein YoaK (UPF0700 family)